MKNISRTPNIEQGVLIVEGRRTSNIEQGARRTSNIEQGLLIYEGGRTPNIEQGARRISNTEQGVLIVEGGRTPNIGQGVLVCEGGRTSNTEQGLLIEGAGDISLHKSTILAPCSMFFLFYVPLPYLKTICLSASSLIRMNKRIVKVISAVPP